MKDPVKRIQGDLDRVRTLLDETSVLSLSEEERAFLGEEVDRLSGKLEDLEEGYLTVGILGGTGVGKSTLMNALAGAEIASTSHRRPHTDHVLIYRHEEAAGFPDISPQGIPWKEFLHREDDIRQTLLCDLPDFDSLAGEHRQVAIRFLDHLDVLVWLTSPEKYADKRFYDFLSEVPKADRNFYFVLNKTDLFFDDKDADGGYRKLDRALRAFEEHILESGVSKPIVFAVSAREFTDSRDNNPWNQMRALRHQIFQHRDAKQVTAIKASNLDVEAKELLSHLAREAARLERLEGMVKSLAEEVASRSPEWVASARKASRAWLSGAFRKYLLSAVRDPSVLMGPGRVWALAFSGFGGTLGRAGNRTSGAVIPEPPKEVSGVFRRVLDWVAARSRKRILEEGLPASLSDRLRDVVGASERFEALGVRLVDVLALPEDAFRVSGFRGFKAVQGIFYIVLFLLFLLAVGGEDAWRGVLEAPGPGSILALTLSIIHSVFSAKGLAALLSYGIVNIVAGFRFYRRYEKRVKRSVERAVDALADGMAREWEETLETLKDDLGRFAGDIKSRRETLEHATGTMDR